MTVFNLYPDKGSAIKELLDANKIEHPVGDQKCLAAAADCVLFGVLPNCPECKTGKLIITTSAKYYGCDGWSASGFTKCEYKTQDAKRVPPKIPKWMKDECTFLFKYKYDPKIIRHFPKQTKGSIKPLTEMKVITLGKFSGKDKVEADVRELGGINAAGLDETVHLIVSTKEVYDRQIARDKPSDRFKKSKTLDTMIVSIEILNHLKTAEVGLGEQRVNLIPILDQYKLSEWGTFKKPGKRKRFFDGEEEASGENKRIKLDISNGVAIDPEADVKPGSSIIESGGKMHTSMMTAINIKQDKNSYYKLQAIQNSKGTKFTLFRSWGRIGSDTIGGIKNQVYHNKSNCLEEFYRLFEEKTQNQFFAKSYTKQPGCFFPMDISYTRDTEVDFDDNKNPSKLDKPVQDLIKLIFDVKAMKKSLVEFELDLEKMPLGKLSNEQLKKAYQLLTDLQKHVKEDNKMMITDCTTQFYHLVPHALKNREELPLLNSDEIIKNKVQMVDSLLEIEQAYQLLNEKENKDENENPIDASYAKLKTELGVLDKGDNFKF